MSLLHWSLICWFFSPNINLYLYFISFFNTETASVEIHSLTLEQLVFFSQNVIYFSDIMFSTVYGLTHWGRDKMAAISQTTLSNAFSWMRMLEFWLKFHWSKCLGVHLTIFQHWFRWWLGADQATSHYLNQWWLVYWRIYASLGLNELTLCASYGITELDQRWLMKWLGAW